MSATVFGGGPIADPESVAFTVIDDETTRPRAQVVFDKAALSEGGGQTAEVRISLDRPATTTAPFTLAVRSSADYNLTPTVVTVPSGGTTSGAATVSAVDNVVYSGGSWR